MCVYLDDILVTSKIEEGHTHNLEALLSRLEAAGIQLKCDKCVYEPSHEYLGHQIPVRGLG